MHNSWDILYILLLELIYVSKRGPSRSQESWASYQIRKIAGCAWAGNAGNVFPRRRFQRKPLVSDPGMHHGTCVTHVPWCMSGSLTYGDGENVPGIPGACAPAILRIWQDAHGHGWSLLCFIAVRYGSVDMPQSAKVAWHCASYMFEIVPLNPQQYGWIITRTYGSS